MFLSDNRSSSAPDGDDAVPARVLLLVDLDVGTGHLADRVDVAATAPDHTADRGARHRHFLRPRHGRVLPASTNQRRIVV